MGSKSAPKPPAEDPEIKRRREEEQRKAEEEKQRQIQENLKNQTVVSSTGVVSRKSTFTKGRAGFSLRSLLGGN